MENTNSKKGKIAIAILALLMVSSIAMISNLASNTASGQADNEDLLQYDWPNHCNDHNTNYNPGPGPTTANILWSARRPGTGSSLSGSPPIAIAGMIICYASNNLYAFDALTGDLKWVLAQW